MNRVIKTIIFGFFILTVHTTFAQRIGYREITEKRIEYIAPRLNLTADESQNFWPLFREFHDEREKISKNSKIRNKQSDNLIPVTEEEFLNAVNFLIDSKMEQAILMKEFNKRYLEILPAEKVYKLYQLDDEFNRFLLKQLKDSGQSHRK